MKGWLKRVWAKRPWHRRKANSAAEDAPLREFIYLDEVSVYSLLASRRGAVPSEQTDSETAQLRQAVDSEIGVGAPVAKATARSQFETTSTRGTQVVRKSIIQSTFKDLVDLEQHRMKLRDGAAPGQAPTLKSAQELLDFDDDEHVLRCSSLERGDLVELQVELTPEDVFTASQIVKSMFTFFEEMPDVFSLDRDTFEQGRMIDSLFDRLLVGLVPIRARAARYRRLSFEAGDYLVSESLISVNPWINALGPEPVHLVGVAEHELFWRDLRRVLFSASPFFILGRLSATGLSSTWSPIKLASVFQSQAPQIARELDRLPTTFLGGMREGLERQDEVTTGSIPSRVSIFAERLAQEVGSTWTAEDSTAAGLDTVESEDDKTLEERRAISERIVTRLETRLGKELDPVVVAELRSDVFDSPDERNAAAGEALSQQGAAGTRQNLLETEIVAIYW